MDRKIYLSTPDGYIRGTKEYRWIMLHNRKYGLIFDLFNEMDLLRSDASRALQYTMESCDAHMVFAIPRNHALSRIGSYHFDIEVNSSIYRRIPIIVIKLHPEDEAVGRMSIDELCARAPGRVRVFDLTAGRKISDLPGFINDFMDECENEDEDDVVTVGELEKPYEGDEPFIFISYSHLDREKVYPVIARLQKDGYRVWYDEGIHAASQWDEFIASHIMDCGCMLALISPNYIDSPNCRDEINFARDLNKERLLIYLEDTKLPPGMAMRLKRLQAINKYECKTGKEFFEKLYSASGISKMKG